MYLLDPEEGGCSLGFLSVGVDIDDVFDNLTGADFGGSSTLFFNGVPSVCFISLASGGSDSFLPPRLGI